jgi:hypothetical protein
MLMKWIFKSCCRRCSTTNHVGQKAKRVESPEVEDLHYVKKSLGSCYHFQHLQKNNYFKDTTMFLLLMTRSFSTMHTNSEFPENPLLCKQPNCGNDIGHTNFKLSNVLPKQGWKVWELRG